MRIKISYSFQPGEKVIEEGFFVCPFCNHKRSYGRIRVTKNFSIEGLSLFPTKNLGEYIRCGGCFKPFPIDTLDSHKQLNIEISKDPLPPENIFELWQKFYQDLECEAILAGDRNVVDGVISPILKTTAANLQKAGVNIRLSMFDEAKVCMLNIFSLTSRWLEYAIQDNYRFVRQRPKLHEKQLQFSEAAHFLMSRLP